MALGLGFLTLLAIFLMGLYSSTNIVVHGQMDIDIQPLDPYVGSRAMFTCTSHIKPVSIKLTAYKQIGGVSSLQCIFPDAILNFDKNTFSGKVEVFGCQGDLRNVTFSVPITRNSEANYTCRIKYGMGGEVFREETRAIALSVRVPPASPLISPSSLVFKEDTEVQINCSAFDGRPPADLTFQVKNEQTGLNKISTGREFVMIKSNVSWAYHMAIVTCTLTNHHIFNATSTKITVNLAPDNPVIYPTLLTFDDGSEMHIGCSALNGQPPADLTLRLTNSQTGLNESTRGLEVASFERTVSREYHRAIVSCSVSNHFFPTGTTSKSIAVNYIYARETTVKISATGNSTQLNCSSYIESNPQALYQWSVTKDYSSTYGPTYTISAWISSRPFVCIATNPATGVKVSVLFMAREMESTVATDSSPVISDSRGILLMVLATTGTIIILVIAVVVTVIVLRRQRNRVRYRAEKRNEASSKTASEDQGTLHGTYSDMEEDVGNVYEDISDYGRTPENAHELTTFTKAKKLAYASLQLRSEPADSRNSPAYSELFKAF